MTATDFVMPKLGLTMTEGTVARWGVAPGSRFAAGDIIVVVETDKIAYDVEAPAPGILHAALVSEGNAVPVGTPIGRWEVGDAEVSLDAPAVTELAVEERAAPPHLASEEVRIPATTRPAGDGERILATPYARRLAREASIDVRLVDGSGPRGRIKAADVNRAIAARGSRAAAPAPSSIAEQPRTAVITAGAEVDITRLLTLNEDINRGLPTLHAELVHYVALAASRAFNIAPDQSLIGLARGRDGAAGMASMLRNNDCRTLGGIVARAESATAVDASSPRGTLWIDCTQEGISFLSADPPDGWSASLSVGSVRREFRPDAEGRPIPAAAANLVLACRAGEFDSASAQSLLGRIRALLETPLLLLAS
jgi:pyruvate dehydrogenase E2 component (dihydrolipoyllysine-residue acetyltransferase)